MILFSLNTLLYFLLDKPRASTIFYLGVHFTTLFVVFIQRASSHASLEFQDFPNDPGCVQQRDGLHGLNLCTDLDLV